MKVRRMPEHFSSGRDESAEKALVGIKCFGRELAKNPADGGVGRAGTSPLAAVAQGRWAFLRGAPQRKQMAKEG